MPTGFLLDIQGCDTALVSHSAVIPSFASTKTQSIMSVPSGQVMTFDPKEGIGDSGGLSINLTSIPSILTDVKTSPNTRLTSALTASSVTPIDVVSTTAFPASGNIWIGAECIAYVGKSATQLGTTSVTRSQLNTRSAKHDALVTVYGFNPFILGRKCWLYRVDLASPASKTLVMTAYIDSVEQSESGYSLSLLSGKKVLTDAMAFAEPFVSGKIYDGHNPKGGKIPPERNYLLLSLASKERKYPTSPFTFFRFGQIGDELVQIVNVDYPATSGNVAAVPSANDEVEVTVTTRTGANFEVGDYVDFVDGSGNIIEEAVQITAISNSSTLGNLLLEHTGQTTSLTTSDKVVSNYKQVLTVDRGQDETQPEEHDNGSDFVEVRKWGFNGFNTIYDILMQVLLSRYGDGSNDTASGRASFDKLPEGWGVGLHSIDDIDIASFQTVENRATARSYRVKEPLPVKDLLRWFALSTNSSIFWDKSGTLVCRPRSDIYPFDASTLEINKTNLVNIPSLYLSTADIVNIVSLKADYSLDGEPFYSEVVLQEESVIRYGKHELPSYEDKGIKYASGMSEMTSYFESYLSLQAFPTPVITVDLAYDPSLNLEPAQVVSLVFPTLFDGAGSSGYNGELFEILEVSPNVPEGIMTLRIKRRATTSNVARINISGIVASKSGSDVTIRTGAASFLSPTNPLKENGFEIDNDPYIGDNDIDYFKQNDSIKLIDVSDIGVGNTVVSSGITSINYATNTMTLSSVPAWLAAGDWVKLDQYSTVKTGGVSERIGFYAWMASNAATPVLGGTDESQKWGS